MILSFMKTYGGHPERFTACYELLYFTHIFQLTGFTELFIGYLLWKTA